MTEVTNAGPHEGTARAADGTILRTLRWAAAGTPRAQALIVHGLGEHCGRYESVAGALTPAGIEVDGYDHRGFGGSAGRRAWLERWSQLHDDLQERLAAVREVAPGLPVVLYGHSMGGLIALGYVLAEPPRPLPDLLVLSAPGIEDDLAAWKHRAAGILGRLLPAMRIPNGIPGDALAAHPDPDAPMGPDPLSVDATTARMGAEGFAEQARVRGRLAALAAMPIPTYVLHGSDDPIVPVQSSEAIGRLAGVTRRVHEGLRHECHHEASHADVLAAVVAWIDAQLAGVAPPPAPEAPIPATV